MLTKCIDKLSEFLYADPFRAGIPVSAILLLQFFFNLPFQVLITSEEEGETKMQERCCGSTLSSC